METENYRSRIYIWSYFYILIVLLFTRFISSYSMAIWGLYLILALPFCVYLDKYVIICFLLSTLSDYFSGVGEGILGMHSIFLVLSIINMFVKKKAKLSLKGLLWPLLLIASIWISYNHSQFNYINGAYSMSYVIIICMAIMGFVKTDKDTLSEFFPALSAIIVIYFALVIISSGNITPTLLTIRSDINHNAFGRCLAQLSTVFAVKVLLAEKKSIFYSIIWGLTIILTIMTGSRNALLAEFVSIVFVYIYIEKQRGKMLNRLMKGLIVASVIMLIANVLLPDVGLYAERYNISTLIATGGTNRTTIWNRLIPLLLKEYTWFGYGPGYYCSAQIVSMLVNRAYTNTHNIIIEVWGELGIIGLVCFLGLAIKSLHQVVSITKKKIYALFILSLFVDVLVNGLGEAMFAGTNLWIIIGLCYSISHNNVEDSEGIYERSFIPEGKIPFSI